MTQSLASAPSSESQAAPAIPEARPTFDAIPLSADVRRAIDELGYLSYDARSADLLFEVVTRRYQEKSTIVSTNRAFAQWNETFPNASCVVTLVDRLIHRSEIVEIDGESYRRKEALERAEASAKARRARRRGKDAGDKDVATKEVPRASRTA